MKMRTILTVGVFAASAALLSACGDDDDVEPVVTPDAPAVEPTDDVTAAPASPSPSPDVTDAPEPASGDVTAPGTTLAVGGSAIVDYRLVEFDENFENPELSADGQLIRIAVNEVSPASFSDLPDDTVVTGAEESDLAVVRVNYEMQIAGPSTLDLVNRNLIGDFSTEGWNSYLFFNNLPDCDPIGMMGEAFAAGDNLQGCFMIMYVAEDGAPNLTFEPYMTDYDENPIVWTLNQ